MQRQEVRVGGRPAGYVELMRLGELWKAVAFGAPPYPPPLFGQKGYALKFVRQYGNGKGTSPKQFHPVPPFSATPFPFSFTAESGYIATAPPKINVKTPCLFRLGFLHTE